MDRYGGRYNFTVIFRGLLVSIVHMLAFMGADSGTGCLRGNVGRGFKGYIFIGAILIFAMLTGLTISRG